MPQEEIDKETGAKQGGYTGQGTTPKGKNAYSKISRELSDEQLTEKGAQILILNELDQLCQENDELKEYRKNFYEVDKTKAVLQEKLNTSKSFEVLYTAGVAIGSTIVAGARVLTGNPQTYFTIAGFVLIGVSAICKVINMDFFSNKNKK